MCMNKYHLTLQLRTGNIMQFDTFQTIIYKGIPIHTKYNRTLKREEVTIQGFESIVLKSVLSAKQRITKIKG